MLITLVGSEFLRSQIKLSGSATFQASGALENVRSAPGPKNDNGKFVHDEIGKSSRNFCFFYPAPNERGIRSGKF